jgi:hypothetical protein
MTLMKLLIAIAALLLTKSISQSLYHHDVTHISPTDRSPSPGYRWWKRASEEGRLEAIAIAIRGLRAGWTFGLNAQLGAVNANLREAYAQHKVSVEAIAVATRPRPVTPPVFIKPLAAYRSKVDNAYARVPSMRKQDVALVLLCFSDSKVITCRDEQGKPLR